MAKPVVTQQKLGGVPISVVALAVIVLIGMGVIIWWGRQKELNQKSFVPVTSGTTPQVAQSNPSSALPSPSDQDGQIISGSFDPTQFKTDDEWKQILTPAQYSILRQAGTETPFTGALENEWRKGTYYSVGCNEPVFRSEQKYDSGTGWPSFWAPINQDALVLRKDDTVPGEPRVEVLDKCGNHLGHVFDDGPQPTGKRYCMNSIALKFVPDPN